MCEVIDIVPGCIVNFMHKGLSMEGEVLLLKNRFYAVLETKQGKIVVKRVNQCSLKNPVINHKVYNLEGSLDED